MRQTILEMVRLTNAGAIVTGEEAQCAARGDDVRHADRQEHLLMSACLEPSGHNKALFAQVLAVEEHLSVQTCVFLGIDQPHVHIVMDDSDGDTIQSEQSICAWCDLQPERGAALPVVPRT